MKFDKYNINARILPAIIGIVPIILFFNFSDWKILQLIKKSLEIQIISNISLSLILIYFLAQVCRGISKEFERILFRDEKGFPTTELLLWSNKTFSNQYKSAIRNKIKQDFNIELPTLIEEDNDPMSARTVISESIGRIRNKVGKGKLLLQHNIEYGFARNLIAASLIGCIISLISLVIFFSQHELSYVYVFSLLTVFYLIYLIMSKNILKRYSLLYAKRLFIEYLD